jgi:hypothetical protein
MRRTGMQSMMRPRLSKAPDGVSAEVRSPTLKSALRTDMFRFRPLANKVHGRKLRARTFTRPVPV